MKRIILLILLGLHLQAFAHKTGNDSETRTASHSVKVSATDVINIQAKNTVLEVEAWDKNEVEVEAEVRFDGKMTENMRQFLDDFEKIVKDNIVKSGSTLTIETNKLEVPNKVQIGSKNSGIIIGYNDRELRISYKVKVPANNTLQIKNTYKDLTMNGRFKDVDISQYSGNLRAQDFDKAKMSLKYGSATLNSIGELNLETYEQKLNLEKVGQVNGTVKYSKIDIKDMGKGNLEAYETKFNLGTVDYLKGTMKYGNMTINDNIGGARFILYEFDITGGSIGNLTLENSKYSKLSLTRAGILTMLQSYEDEITLTNAGQVNTSSKYGKYSISQLEESFVLNGYEDKITISGVSAKANTLQVNGKYISLTANLTSVPFSLNGSIKYGKVTYNEALVNVSRYIKENDNLQLAIESKKSGDSPLNVTLNGYELKAIIN
jgi:hypothetical protein